MKNLEAEYKSFDLPIDSSEVHLSEHIYPEHLSYNSYNPYPSFMDRQQMNGVLDDASYGFPRYSKVDAYPDDNDLAAEESKLSILREVPCTASDARSCGENEACLQPDPKSPGVCHCSLGYIRNSISEKCILMESNMMADPDNFNQKMMIIKHLTENRENGVGESKGKGGKLDPTIGHLAVSVVSKTVQLPDNKATLSAFPVPDEQTSGILYNYSWSLISQPSGDVNGSMSDKTRNEIRLTNLSEGLYRFKVVVSGKGWSGEAFANVTVLPEKRFNKAPIVVIKPAQQIIKAPTNSAILDGSSSTVN